MTKKNIDQEYKQEIEQSLKMFDVSKPNTSRPASTSRPVIVGHTATITNDPMVKDDGSVKVAVQKKPRKSIAVDTPDQALVQPDKDLDDTPIAKPEPEAAKEIEAPKRQKIIMPDTEPEKPAVEPKVEEVDPSPSPVVDTLIDQVPDKKQEDKELEDLAIRTEEARKSIESKEFFLPITTSEQKRNTQVVAGVFIVIAGAIIAGLIMSLGSEKIKTLLNL